MLENFDSKHSTEYILPLFKTIPCGNTDYYREGTFKFPSERVPSCYYSRQQITGNSIPIELVPEIFKGSLLSKYKLINEIKIINNQYESDEETDALILELLTSVNKYNIIHKEISELFNKVCKLGNELIKTCYIRYYTTTNVIPQPYYQLLRSMVKEKGKDLGDYSFYESFIIYMMGSIIGFVIVEEKKLLEDTDEKEERKENLLSNVVLCHFESPKIKEHFFTIFPKFKNSMDKNGSD